MKPLAADGVTINVPRGWDARASRRHGTLTLHLANYAIPSRDGEFGPRATRTMPSGGVFLALTEYQAVLAGKGLYRRRRIPTALAPAEFSTNAVLNARRNQFGIQEFFSASGRPFCLYAVVRAPQRRAKLVAHVNAVLQTLQIE